MLEDLVDMLDTNKPLIFQEMITASSGKDLRVFVIGGRVVGAMMRYNASNFKANVHQGGSVRPIKLSAQVRAHYALWPVLALALTDCVCQCEWLVLETVRIIG